MQKILNSFKSYQLDNLYQIGVYKISFESTAKFYIGSTISVGTKKSSRGFYNRWARHLRMLKNGNHSNKYLQNTFNKYGLDNIKFEILFTSSNKEEILKKEQELINTTKCYLRTIGYNIQKIVGTVQLLEANYNTKKIAEYNLQGVLIKIWDSTKAAAEYYQVLPCSIWNVLNGKNTLCKQSMWKYYNSTNTSIPSYQKLKTTRKKVKQFDLNNNFIKEWESLRDISYFFNNNYNCGTLSNAIKTTGKYKGFIWKV